MGAPHGEAAPRLVSLARVDHLAVVQRSLAHPRSTGALTMPRHPPRVVSSGLSPCALSPRSGIRIEQLTLALNDIASAGCLEHLR